MGKGWWGRSAPGEVSPRRVCVCGDFFSLPPLREKAPQLVILQIISAGDQVPAGQTHPYGADVRRSKPEVDDNGSSDCLVFGVAIWNIRSWLAVHRAPEAAGVLFSLEIPVGNGSEVQRPIGKWIERKTNCVLQTLCKLNKL